CLVSRLAPVLLSGFTSQRAGVFSFQQPMPPGIKPRNIAPHRITSAWCGYYVAIHLHFIPEMFAMKSTFRLFNSCCSGFVQGVVQARNSD
ncbi:TPA: hypothetical protein ACIYC4_001729, partial [Escherichia coli]